MREMLLGDFSGFPKLSHVLNLHLQYFMVPRSIAMDKALTKLSML